MRRMIGMDIHRTEGFGRSLGKEDEVVIEAAGNAMAVVHVPSPYVARVLAANPLQVKAIACARQDGQDRCRCAGIAAGRQFSAGSLVAGFGYRAPAPIGGTPQSGCPAPHADQEPGARDPARPSDPPCPHAHLFGRLGRIWLAQQLMPDDEGAAIERHRRELDRLSGDLGALDTQIAQAGSDDPAVKRLLTITGVNLIVAAGGNRRCAPLHQSAAAGQLCRPKPAGAASQGCPAYAYKVKALRDREIELARHAEQAYERFVSQWQRRGTAKQRTSAANEEQR